MRRLFILLLCVVACTGTDVGNPPRSELTMFDNSGCKQPDFSKGIEPIGSWRPDPLLYAGLTCLEWELVDDGLRIRIINHSDSCGLDEVWQPRIAQRDEGIDILLDNPSCSFAGCFGCQYDLAFDVRVPAERRLPALALRVLGDDCNHQPRNVSHALMLPIADSSSGASCRYTYKNGVVWRGSHPISETLRVPCGTFEDPSAKDCSQGMECVHVGADQDLCLPRCASDADCQPSELTLCSAGTCQLRAPH